MFPEYAVVEIDPQLAQQACQLSVILPIFDDISLRSRSSQLELSEPFAHSIPGWDALILKIRGLVQLHGWALVRGLQFDQENRLSMGLAASFCVPIEPYHLPHTQMV